MKKQLSVLCLALLLLLVGCVRESPEPTYVPPTLAPEDREMTHTDVIGSVVYSFYNDKTCHVTEFMEDEFSGTSLAIPEEQDGHTVIAVEKEVFRDASLHSVTLPDTVKTLGEGAFRGAAIYEMILPASLEQMGAECFDNCLQLKSVIFPATLREIPLAAFYGCRALEKVILPEGVEVIGEEAFASLSSLGELSLPETLREIGPFAFWASGTDSLIVTVPESVQTVGEEAFGGIPEKNVYLQGELR